MRLLKKLADNEAFLNWVARRIAGYMRWVHNSSTWTRVGYEPLLEALENDEVIIGVLWHQRLAQTPYVFPLDLAPMCTITSSARAGSMVGRIQKLFGMDTIAMSSHKRHVALSRQVLGKMKQGISIGIAADGPRGPERVASAVPLVWARSTGKRVFCFTYATQHGSEAGSWDRLLMPHPWTKGVLMCREWTETVPRKATEEQIETLRQSLEAMLNQITAEADEMVGRTPWQPPSQG